MLVADFWPVFIHGKKQQLEDRVYAQWCAVLPHLQDKSLYSFKTYLERATGADIDRRPTEQILAEIDEAMRRLESGN